MHFRHLLISIITLEKHLGNVNVDDILVQKKLNRSQRTTKLQFDGVAMNQKGIIIEEACLLAIDLFRVLLPALGMMRLKVFMVHT